jgi:hypothetical protein
MGKLSWIICLFNIILKVLKWEEGQSQRRRWGSGTEAGGTLLVEKCHKQRQVGSLWTLQQTGAFSTMPPEEQSPGDTLVLAQ